MDTLIKKVTIKVDAISVFLEGSNIKYPIKPHLHQFPDHAYIESYSVVSLSDGVNIHSNRFHNSAWFKLINSSLSKGNNKFDAIIEVSPSGSVLDGYDILDIEECPVVPIALLEALAAC